MLFNALLLPLVGILISAGDSSRIIKILLLAVIGLAVLRRRQDYSGLTSSSRNGALFKGICIFQLTQSLSWLLIYVNRTAGLELSRLPIIALALLPWIAIWIAYSSSTQSTKLLGMFPSSLGVVFWGCGSVVLNLFNYNPNATEIIYGGTVEGTVLSDSRTVLPGFPGIVSGGVFCGLGIMCILGRINKSGSIWSQIWMLIPICLLANGVRVTDTRSAAVLVTIFPSVAVFSWLYPNQYVESLDRWFKKFTKVMIAAATCLPFIAPLIFPALEKINLSVELIGMSSLILRTKTESIFSFSGRSGIWSAAVESILEKGPSFASFHPLGEYGSGVSDILFLIASMPGTPESAHSHNGVLNYYFSFGIVGLLFLAAMLYQIYRILSMSSTNNELRELQYPFSGLMLLFTFESLFSPQYLYFGLYFTLLSLDIYCKSEKPVS